MSRPLCLVLLAFAASTNAGRAARAEPSVGIVPLGFEVTEFRGPGSRVGQTVASVVPFREARPALAGPAVVVWGKTDGAVLALQGGQVVVRPGGRIAGDLAALERGRAAIPSSHVAASGPLSVTLEGPTPDYPHEALGSAIHARTVAITERQPAAPSAEPKAVPTTVARVESGEGAVFEDREPRLLDLDGDGTPEIMVVRSFRTSGSSLAVIGRREGAWRIVAETPADGEPFRWLDPIAGSLPGRPGEIALVRRPHLDGLLQVWRYADGRLSLVAEKAGYANHAFGSTAQDLGAVFEAADGSARLAIPVLDRKAIAVLSLAGGKVDEVARLELPARALTGLAVLGRGADAHILVGLEDGRVAAIRL